MGLKDIEAIVRCWALSGMSTLAPRATAEELENAALTLGRRLPDELVALYSHCNGGDILGGNIDLHPVNGEKMSLVEASDFLRRHQWPIPQEVIVFASDGADDLFGLWLPENETSRPLVVEIGEIFEADSFAVIGTSLSGFLRGRSAFYALMYEVPDDVLRVLGVPERFTRRHAEGLDDHDYEALMRWANPDLPNLPISSYEARLTAKDVQRLAEASG